MSSVVVDTARERDTEREPGTEGGWKNAVLSRTLTCLEFLLLILPDACAIPSIVGGFMRGMGCETEAGEAEALEGVGRDVRVVKGEISPAGLAGERGGRIGALVIECA